MVRNRSGGFTLVELLVVILILGIVAAFAWPRLPRLTGAERSAAVRRLAFAVRTLHEQAVFKKKA